MFTTILKYLHIQIIIEQSAFLNAYKFSKLSNFPLHVIYFVSLTLFPLLYEVRPYSLRKKRLEKEVGAWII